MLEGVPNLALAVGYTNASWTLKCDLTCDYVVRLLNHMRAPGCASARRTGRRGAVTAEPLLGLTSGYVQRSADRFPKQGSEFPWQVHQSYLRDYRALKSTDVVDDAMEFSNPVPGGAAVSPASTSGAASSAAARDLRRPRRRHHRRRVGHRSGAGRGARPARAPPRALRHRRGRAGRDRRPAARAPGSRSPRSASTSPTATPSTPGPTRSSTTTARSTSSSTTPASRSAPPSRRCPTTTSSG